MTAFNQFSALGRSIQNEGARKGGDGGGRLGGGVGSGGRVVGREVGVEGQQICLYICCKTLLHSQSYNINQSMSISIQAGGREHTEGVTPIQDAS